MMRIASLLIALCLADAASADVVVPVRTIRANALIAPGDLALKPADIEGAYAHPADVIGQEARVALYPGRPVRYGDIGPPALVDRNQIVVLIFQSGGLRITAEGRALMRGAVGDYIRVMNLTSRSTVSGQVGEDGTVRVQN